LRKTAMNFSSPILPVRLEDYSSQTKRKLLNLVASSGAFQDETRPEKYLESNRKKGMSRFYS
jgi:hypothetical protein